MTLPAADKKLDVCGLKCPLPLLRTQSELAKLSESQVLAIISDDANSKTDISSYCIQSGNQLLNISQHGKRYYFLIRKT